MDVVVKLTHILVKLQDVVVKQYSMMAGVSTDGTGYECYGISDCDQDCEIRRWI